MSTSIPRLRVHHPPGTERFVHLDRDPFTIGRRPECDLVIAEKDISRVQAEIRREAGGWVLEDRGSTFGTDVNGVPVREHLLRNRDRLSMGRERQIELVFLHEDRMSRIIRQVDSHPSEATTPDHMRNLQLLLEISKGFNSTTSLQEMLELILDAVVDVAQAERGFVMLKDEEGALRVHCARSMARESLSAEGLRFSRSLVDEVALGGQPRYFADVRDDPGIRNRRSAVELELRSLICLPLRLLPAEQTTRPASLGFPSEVIGVIYADSLHAHRPLTTMTRDLLESIAVQGSLAIENFLLRQEDLERRLVERETDREVERLRDLDRLKTQFVSNVSHELRTPLTAIKGSIDNMLDGLTGQVNERQQRYLERMRDNAGQLTRMIDDLLDLARIEEGRVRLESRSTSVCRLIEDAAESLRPLAERRQVSLRVDPPGEDLVVQADRDRLMQVLFNLTGNALKFTEPGGAITLAARRVAGQIEIQVADTGCGIPERDLERVFDRFYQVRGDSGEKAGGSGLGLPIARSLVELHGGRMWAERAAAGTRFIFTLPGSPTAPDAPA